MANVVEKSPNAEPGYRRLAAHWRVILSVVLLVHLTAVFIAPMALPPSSQLIQDVRRPFSDYLNVAYLDHGYRFFAPSPGPSHLVRYDLELPSGEHQTGTFPDLKEQWPRLIYHRHFMLSEKFFNWAAPELPADAPTEFRQRWQRDRDVFLAIARSYAQHLMSVNNGRQVKLELVQHNLASPQEILAGRQLADPKSYEVMWTGTFERDPS